MILSAMRMFDVGSIDGNHEEEGEEKVKDGGDGGMVGWPVPNGP